MPPPGPPPKPPRRSTHPLEARSSKHGLLGSSRPGLLKTRNKGFWQSSRDTQDSGQVFLAGVALYRRLGTRLFGSRTLRRAPQGSSPWTSFADFLSRALLRPIALARVFPSQDADRPALVVTRILHCIRLRRSTSALPPPVRRPLRCARSS